MEKLEICGNDTVKMACDEAGKLHLWEGQEWKEFPFNAIYRGYFPACRFTAVGYFAEQFYAAGVDDGGDPHLFLTAMGKVWVEQNLTATGAMGEKTRLRGEPVKLLCSREPFQVHLMTNAGQLASIPDCPKCIRIKTLEGIPRDGWISGSSLHIRWENGGEGEISLLDASRYRVAWSYAAGMMASGKAIVADLRSREAWEKGHFPRSISLPAEGVEDWLQTRDKEECILFLCRFGVQADNAAICARRMGFSRAYSLGGTEEFAHLD